MTTTHDVPMPEPDVYRYDHWIDGPRVEWSLIHLDHSFTSPGVEGYVQGEPHFSLAKLRAYADARCAKLQEERDALRKLIDSPELHDFARGAVLEAAHQVERWGTDHDSGKTPADWFWLVGYLAGKALHAQTSGNTEKALHHTISTAAALANWHRAINGANDMRPGIDPPIGATIDAAGDQP